MSLEELWSRSRGAVSERVATVELATRELAAEPSDVARIAAGRAEAHKLAGLLGSFGLGEGTELARDLEEHLVCPTAHAEAERLAQVAAALRAVVDRAPA